jgi:hypothetical protein
VVSDEGNEPFATDEAYPRGKLVEDDQGGSGKQEDPQELVTKFRAENGICGDAGGIVVGESREEPRADDGQESW